MHQLPHKNIDPQEKKIFLKTMRIGNKLLHKWASKLYGKKKTIYLRNLILKNESPREIPPEDIRHILAVKNIEEAMIKGHIRLISKVIKPFLKASPRLSFSDLQAVGLLALRDAIWSYRRKRSKDGRSNKIYAFTTYATTVIRNRVYQELYSLTINNKSIRVLLHSFEELQKYNPGKTIDEILLSSFTPKESKKIMSHYKVTQFSDLDNEEQNSIDIAKAKQEIKLDSEVLRAVQIADFTDLERDVFLAYLSPYRGWQTDISKKYRISRAAIGSEIKLKNTGSTTGVLGRCIKKIRSAYKKSAAIETQNLVSKL